MADRNINQLTEKTTIEDGDFIPIWDTVGADTNKQDVATLRRSEVREITSSGAQSGAGVSKLHIRLNHAMAINYTITGAPTVGDTITLKCNTTAVHTLLLDTGVTFDGTNATMTYSTIGESLHMVAISTTEWDIINNNGGVLSA